MLDFTYSKDRHFFFSSFSTWATDDDFENGLKRFLRAYRSDACKIMRKGVRLPFNVYSVPLNKSACYKIENYMPRVDGVVLIAVLDAKQ